MEFQNPNSNKDIIITLKRWLENRNHKKTFADYFRECGYETIAIVDAGEIGRILYDELKESEINVKWFADENAEGIREIEGIPVCLMKDMINMSDVDIICISPIFDYAAITRYLVNKNCKIATLCLKDAVYEF
ncbi:MAG: hypothetical protein IJ716_09585 [Lachnospiraceae bacterium]|nr:hypothetical protein [Lachnospiraceae bacterium]